MSVSMNNLFNFSRALPEPFDKLVSKKVKVTSKYGSATEATLSCTVIKAVHAVCNCMVGTGEGAVGTIDHRTVAEYKSSAGPDMYHLVVFDSGSGNIMASIYDNNTETIENYKLHQSAQDGAAVMMAMMPLLLKDDEYGTNYLGAPLLGLVVWCVVCFALNTLLDWLYEKTGCIWVPAIAHGALNAVASMPVVLTDPAEASYYTVLGPMPIGLIGMLPVLAVAVWLTLRQMKREEKN